MAVPAIKKINFQAQWTPDMNYLNPSNRSIIRKVYDFVKSIVFFIPYTLLEPHIRRAVLPLSFPKYQGASKHHIDNKHFEEFWINKTTDPTNIWNQSMGTAADSCKAAYTPIELNMTTPDKVSLKGQFLKHKNHDKSRNSRVIILFHGNDVVYQDAPTSWMMDFLKDSKTPYSFLLFNTRSLGESKKGLANSKNLLLDSETAYQLVKDELHIPESRIDLYGHSFGGAQALQLKKLHPHTRGKVLIDRTFVTLDAIAFHALGTLVAFIKNFGLYLVKKIGWEFNNYDCLKAIKDPVHVFYNKRDYNIPEQCSLGKAVLDKNPRPANVFIHTYDSYVGAHHSPLTDLNLVDDPKGLNSTQLLRDIF